jgi:hypothetical protein
MTNQTRKISEKIKKRNRKITIMRLNEGDMDLRKDGELFPLSENMATAICFTVV